MAARSPTVLVLIPPTLTSALTAPMATNGAGMRVVTRGKPPPAAQHNHGGHFTLNTTFVNPDIHIIAGGSTGWGLGFSAWVLGLQGIRVWGSHLDDEHSERHKPGHGGKGAPGEQDCGPRS
eukprot:3332968-Pyramimonas_sp.AAC.1